MGKSVYVNFAARSINNDHREYKIFYIDASRTFTLFLKKWYGLDYSSEKEAVTDWMNSLGQYAAQHPEPRILVILDSPGGWEKALDAKTMDQVMRFMKDSVASDAMTFYCLSSPDNESKKNIFTPERVTVFGSRFHEIKQFGEHKEWGIDFTLDSNEKDQLIKTFTSKNPSVKFTEQEKEDLRLNLTNSVGDFLFEMGEKAII